MLQYACCAPIAYPRSTNSRQTAGQVHQTVKTPLTRQCRVLTGHEKLLPDLSSFSLPCLQDVTVSSFLKRSGPQKAVQSDPAMHPAVIRMAWVGYR